MYYIITSRIKKKEEDKNKNSDISNEMTDMGKTIIVYCQKQVTFVWILRQNGTTKGGNPYAENHLREGNKQCPDNKK